MTVPKEAHTIGEELGWSEPRDCFFGATGLLIFGYLLTSFFVAVTILTFGFAFFAAILNPRALGGDPGTAAGVGGMFFAISAVLGLMLAYYSGTRVYLYREGMVYLSRKKRIVSRWQDH